MSTPAKGDNRLPELAAEIRKAHADVQDAAKTAAERAIEAGRALIEAKELVQHGEWLPWLREHCALAERTARLYMQVAKSGHPAEVIAAVGLKAATEAVQTFTYDPFAYCTPEGIHDWAVFSLFLVVKLGFHPDGAEDHMNWILRKAFKDPDEWMGDEGDKYRRKIGMKAMRATCKDAWKNFLAENCSRTDEDIKAELARFQDERGLQPSPPPKRRRRKSATVADLAGG